MASGSTVGGGGRKTTAAQRRRVEDKSVVVTDTNGGTIDLSDSPLVYGSHDGAVSGALRTALEGQESKRLSAKVEYAQSFDENGNPTSKEKRGGGGAVKVTYSQLDSAVLTHNHPRGEGELGGTFSQADIRNFSHFRMNTHRASAKEGTYSISKGSNFDGAGLRRHYADVDRSAYAAYKSRNASLTSSYRSGSITWDQYSAGASKSFNTYLVDLHNGLLSGQQQYGYTYTLERRGS